MTKREVCLRALLSLAASRTADVHGPINFEILTTLQHPAARSLLPADNASCAIRLLIRSSVLASPTGKIEHSIKSSSGGVPEIPRTSSIDAPVSRISLQICCTFAFPFVELSLRVLDVDELKARTIVAERATARESICILIIKLRILAQKWMVGSLHWILDSLGNCLTS